MRRTMAHSQRLLRLSYGLTVDGKQRQSLAYDAMARCTKETVALPSGQTRENRFIYGTLRHLTGYGQSSFGDVKWNRELELRI